MDFQVRRQIATSLFSTDLEVHTVGRIRRTLLKSIVRGSTDLEVHRTGFDGLGSPSYGVRRTWKSIVRGSTDLEVHPTGSTDLEVHRSGVDGLGSPSYGCWRPSGARASLVGGFAILVRIVRLASDLVQKSAWRGRPGLAPFAPCQREGEGQEFLGSRDPDVTEPSFFGDVVFFSALDAAAVRQESVFHANHEHVGKLQSLGCMHRQQPDGILLGQFVLLVAQLAARQGNVGKKSGEIGVLGAILVSPDRIGHFLQRTLPSFAFFGLIVNSSDFIGVGGALEQRPHGVGQRFACRPLSHVVGHRSQLGNPFLCALAGQSVRPRDPASPPKPARPRSTARFSNGLDRLVAQSASRRVDHAQQRDFIGGLFDPFQVRDQVADFLCDRKTIGFPASRRGPWLSAVRFRTVVVVRWFGTGWRCREVERDRVRSAWRFR